MPDHSNRQQTQLFTPTVEERARAMHQEIDELGRRLHTLIEEVAEAHRAEDTKEEAVLIRPRDLKRLLDLASQSTDLVGRARLAWNPEDAILREWRDGFNNRLLADVAAQDDLSFADCARVLDKIYGDSDDCLPEVAGAALVRAWIRSDGPYTLSGGEDRIHRMAVTGSTGAT